MLFDAAQLARRTSIIVPVLNAQAHLPGLLAALSNLPHQPRRVLFIDSASTDDTVSMLLAAGHKVHSIARHEFGHGKTRNLGARLCADSDFLVYLTQDALPQGPDWLQQLLSPMQDERVALVYGRQLPRPEASLPERHARCFNYPDTPSRSEWADLTRLGIKGVFCSNSFAAYRRAALEAVGHFPEQLPMGEDMAVALRLLQRGYARVYQPTAQAIHSHDYRIGEEFRRYFDIGVLMSMDAELQRVRLAASGEGLRFVKEEITLALQQGQPWWVPALLARTAAKFLGFYLGQRHKLMPGAWLPHLSMHRHFWST